MIFSDHEWLRFVTLALVAGAVMGALYTGALLAGGRQLVGAMVGAILGTTALAVALHLLVRWLLGRADDPAATRIDDENAPTGDSS